MALLHQAQLTPSKIDLLRGWVPSRPWLGGADTSTLEAVGAYRFDDPDDEVGIEVHLLRTADDRILQVPLTYRAAPLEGAEQAFVGTMQHSVLGQRWTYDGCADPVFVRTLAATVLTGGHEAELQVATDSGLQRREATTRVSGSGGGAAGSAVPALSAVEGSDDATTTRVRAGGVELVVVRVIGSPADAPDGAATLTGTWPGHDTPALLAVVT